MLQNLTLTRPLAVLDLETTGTQPANDRIIELAILRLSPGADAQWFYQRINPSVPIPPSASAVHGITDADVASLPRFDYFAASVAAFLDGCDFLGFGLSRFDLPLSSLTWLIPRAARAPKGKTARNEIRLLCIMWHTASRRRRC